MDTRTGVIAEKEQLRKLMGEADFAKFAKPVNVDDLPAARREQLITTGRTKVGPNEKCPCGSGRKFKKCCRFPVHI